VLGGAVRTQEWNDKDAAHRRSPHDLSALTGNHLRHDGLDKLQMPEDVDVEGFTDPLKRDVNDCTSFHHAGIEYQHIDIK
jgi:hypothetical protein